MRIFIGIPVDENLKMQLIQEQKKLVKYFSKSRLTDENNFHITLLFIGELSSDQVEILHKKLLKTLDNNHNFNLLFNTLGYFKKSSDAVIWISPSFIPDDLNDLYLQVYQSVKELYIPVQNSAFHPHLTLARRTHFKDLEGYHQEKIKPYELHVQQINLYLSSQIEGKLTYTPLHTYHLH